MVSQCAGSRRAVSLTQAAAQVTVRASEGEPIAVTALWQPHSGLCQLCRACEQQRSCSPSFRRKELHATEGAVEVRRAWRRLEDTVTDERVGLFTPDKDRCTECTADGAGRARVSRAARVIAARRGPSVAK